MGIRTSVRAYRAVWIAGWLLAAAAAATTRAMAAPSAAPPPAAERVGPVSFAVSCAPKVSRDFNRGVALLHDFWYEESSRQFAAIVQSDPTCAMAHWGLAMSRWHPIWDRPDADAWATGWREMQAAQAHPAKTARERDYIAALSNFFRPGPEDFSARVTAYETAMGNLYARYPEDVDAAAFYALSLLASVAPTDTSLTHERKAMSILTPLWKAHPDHPGLVHYIIHACDTPALAHDGLAAARHYGEVAPAVPHAVHMPAHIFARLGMWQDDIEVNIASIAASDAAEARGASGWMDQFHADDFLIYAYLQSGQEGQARATVAAAQAAMSQRESMPGMHTEHYMTGMFPYYRTKLPLFVALETRDWKTVAALQPVADASPETQSMTYWARLIAAGHLRNVQQARADLAAYDGLMAEVRKGRHAYFADSTGGQIARGELSGWVAFAAGDLPEALQKLRAAADLQDKVGQVEVDLPAREMLADILLESGKPREALAEYQQSMKVSPNRFNALFNAGKAAEAAGDPGAARGYYVALLKSTDNGAHSTRVAEIEHAKAFVATASR